MNIPQAIEALKAGKEVLHDALEVLQGVDKNAMSRTSMENTVAELTASLKNIVEKVNQVL